MLVFFHVFIRHAIAMRRVTQTRDARYLTCTPSFFLALGSALWFAYGIIARDIFIWLGKAEVILYFIYRTSAEAQPLPVLGSPKTLALETISALTPSV